MGSKDAVQEAPAAAAVVGVLGLPWPLLKHPLLKHPHFHMLFVLHSWPSPQKTGKASPGPGLRDAKMNRGAWPGNASRETQTEEMDILRHTLVLLKPLLEPSL